MDPHLLSPDFLFPEEGSFWYEVFGERSRVPVQKQSAFRPYNKADGGGAVAAGNIKRRMADLLRRNWEERRKAAAPARDRCRRHMINERARRDKQRQSYFALHSLLPSGTKNDKNSIVQSALNRIGELQRQKRELERRIHVLEANLKTASEEKQIALKVEDPVSGTDSMLEALKCLKAIGAKSVTIQAKFSPREFSTTMTIESQIAGGEVEQTLEKTLQEAEWKLLFLPEASFCKD
ncbi:PREDICTED: transcription factor bHLH92-like [Tarenaya hassleriana]|uniref:transcription factor bHLH92-like n=1 Tax=Tarenaya hassleriana TaxID=28532 RepID=UPI00053C69CA|nr:PREDICTED: transcription factor bHLH92-like [Tarenaya hassleriana]